MIEIHHVSLFRSCTLCVQGSSQKQDVAEPLCRPPSLTHSVHGAREGPAPRAQVSSLLALPCPLPGASNPPGGADSLPFPSSLDGITAVDLVKPSAKSPHAAAGRWRLGAGALLDVLAPAAPRPLLGLLGVESPGDPACTGRLPAAVGRPCARGWLRSPCPSLPPLRSCPLAALLCFRSLPGPGSPLLVAVAMLLRPTLPLPVPGQRRRWGLHARSAAAPFSNVRWEAAEGAESPLLGLYSRCTVASKWGD